MSKKFAFTLDLEADHAGIGNTYHIFTQPDRIESVLRLLSSYQVKLTAFVVGELFERYPHIIELFARYDTEFELHSYSHKLDEPDSAAEIERGMVAYEAFLGRLPQGYRAPQGIITDAGLKRLVDYGFVYDASVFPSYFPKPWRYLLKKRAIHWHAEHPIVEIPFTSITPFRITLSLSYVKLLGYPAYQTMFQLFGLPDFICFDSHLHDFVSMDDSYQKLPPFWRAIYGRNRHEGMDICERLLLSVLERGYEFSFVSEVYQDFLKKKPAPNQPILLS